MSILSRRGERRDAPSPVPEVAASAEVAREATATKMVEKRMVNMKESTKGGKGTGPEGGDVLEVKVGELQTEEPEQRWRSFYTVHGAALALPAAWSSPTATGQSGVLTRVYWRPSTRMIDVLLSKYDGSRYQRTHHL